MATRGNNIMYAMYVIGEVESGHDWASVYYSDPITIGMMQAYAYNAARLLRKCKESDPNWETFAVEAPRIVGYMNQWSDDSNNWTGVYLTQKEGNAWKAMARSDANHVIQQNDWIEECGGYMDKLVNSYGFSDDRPQTLIYACCMYHQGPKYAIQVINSVGGRATLKTLHNACLNNRVLGQYRNRYNTTYNMLKDWNGETQPPDFGQVSDTDTSLQPNKTATSNAYTGGISRVSYSQGRMIIYGNAFPNGIQMRETTPGNWIPQQSVGTLVDGSDSKTNEWTGGGSSTGTATGDAKKVCDLYDSWVGRGFKYSQSSGVRLNLPDSGASDCSGSIWCAYNLAIGKNVGTWTGEQIGKGILITSGKCSNFNSSELAKLQPADLIIFNYDGSSTDGTDHVEMFMGSGYTQNLLGGGSEPVPHYKDCMNYVTSTVVGKHPNAHYWVKRYI